MQLTELETPALVLDAQRVQHNCERMRSKLRPHQVQLRPHVKTAKSIEVARLAAGLPSTGGAGDPGPITVSTLREAEHFMQHGYRDILYAVGLAPNKFDHVLRLRDAGADLKCVVDSLAAARAVRDFGERQALSGARRLPILIEIDCDNHRSGVKPDDATLLGALGHVLESQWTTLAGVMTHAGESYNCRSLAAIRQMAAQERQAILSAAGHLQAQGLPCPIRSVGSTPTVSLGESFEGLTEVRPGVYVFFDLVMAGLNVCRTEDIALSVLTSVIGHQPDKGWLLTDAGWMAMSRDRGTARQPVDQGYGLVCDLACEPVRLSGASGGDLVMVDANQEHGILARRDGGPIDPAQFPVGTLLRVLPNHACATAAQYPGYRVVHGADAAVREAWSRVSGW